MIQKLLKLLLILVPIFGIAQYTSIPDSNFEQKLYNLGYDSVNGDHRVLTASIATITSLNVSSLNIQNLTGIRSFTALQNLYCDANQMTSLDVSNMPNLKLLNCANGRLTSLNVTGSTALETINCYRNQIASLDVSGLTSLKYLNCFSNQLTALALPTGNALLELYCHMNVLSSLDVSSYTALTKLDCSENELTSLILGNLTALTELNCWYNYLTELNAQGLTALTIFNCYYTSLASLNIKGLPATCRFDASYNASLTCITVTNPTIAAANGNWTKDATTSYSAACVVPVSGPSASVLSGNATICVGSNATMSVAITGGQSPYSVTYSDGTSNTTITNYVSNSNISVNPSSTTTYTLVSVTDNNANSGSGNAGSAVVTVTPRSNPTFDALSPVCEGTAITASLPLISNNGVSGSWSPYLNYSVTTTYTFTPSNGQCANTATLTQTVLPLITYYSDADGDGYGDRFSSLNTCTGMPLGYTLDLSDCDDTSAAVHPGATEICYDGIDNNCDGHIDEGCIVIGAPIVSPQHFEYGATVGDLVAIGTNLKWYINDTATIPLDPANPLDRSSYTYYVSQTIEGIESARAACLVTVNLYTSIPDANLEQRLYDLGYDTVNGDHQILIERARLIVTLDVHNSNIADFTGVRQFSALNYLICTGNQLTNLDLSGLQNLQFVNCSYNQITHLNVSGLQNLQTVNCANNQIGQLTLTGLPQLQTLIASRNQLTSLDLNGLHQLTYLACQNNQIGSLNIGDAPALTEVYCMSNTMTSLTLNNNAALQTLQCYDNNLTQLNISNTPALQVLDCSMNLLTQLSVDNLTGLSAFNCSSNYIAQLNVVGLPNNCQFDCTSTPNLSCIAVSNPNVARTNSTWFKNSSAHYSTNCSLVLGATSAVLSGSSSICVGSSAALKITITGGSSPFAVTYFNGTANVTVLNYVSGTDITIAPNSTKTYTLIAVYDSNGEMGTGISGSATITVHEIVTPIFTQIDPICTTPSWSTLSTSSNNGVVGSWSPAIDFSSTKTYTFTPDAQQCANSATMTIVVLTQTLYYKDFDNDGFGDASNTQISCSGLPTGYVSDATECNDANNTVYPGALEICGDGLDNNCNGQIDEGCTIPTPIASAQTFCEGAKVAHLVATGTSLKWYALASGGAVLDNNQLLSTGVYFVSQTLTNIESARVAVSVMVHATPVLASQSYYVTAGIPLSSVPGYGTSYAVYASATALTALPASTILNAGTYFATLTQNDCVSNRASVSVLVYSLTKVSSPTCGTVLNSISAPITAVVVPNATNYLFEVTTFSSTRTFYSNTNSFDLTQLQGSITYDTTCTIRVAAGFNGQYGDFGASCVLTTPTLPNTTQIIRNMCGTVLTALSTPIYCGQIVGAQAYRFEVTANGNTRTLDSNSNSIQLTNLAGGVTYATVYSVRVACKNNGEWQPYGSTCTVTTPAASTQIRTFQCGTTLANKWSILYCSAVTGATAYRFEWAFANTLTTYTSSLPNMQLGNMIGWLVNKRYSVRVAVQFGGVWQDYGSSCYINTPTSNARHQADIESALSIKAIPNPFETEYVLMVQGGNQTPVQVAVYDMLGKQVEQFSVEANELENRSLGTNYSSGIYNVMISQGDEQQVVRIIKK
ncbi:MAG: hypothetical protein CFE24_12255 [Flavobacterium sp. BFFFF2]|nr:MAG: hypothetical protein CFE24_12255 [Flavobacterium sp. BFFFF2]